MSDALKTPIQSDGDEGFAFDELHARLEARATGLHQRFKVKPNLVRLEELRKERENLVKRLNGDVQLAHPPVKKRKQNSVAFNLARSTRNRFENTQLLSVFVSSYDKKLYPGVKANFHSREATVGMASAAARTLKINKTGMDKYFRTEDVLIHVIERQNFSSPHGEIVAMRPDGTIIKTVGVYGQYGKAHNVTVKVDMKDLKGMLMKGAVATSAAAQLVVNLKTAGANVFGQNTAWNPTNSEEVGAPLLDNSAR